MLLAHSCVASARFDSDILDSAIMHCEVNGQSRDPIISFFRPIQSGAASLETNPIIILEALRRNMHATAVLRAETCSGSCSSKRTEAAGECEGGVGGIVIGVRRVLYEYTADGSAAVEEGELPDLSFKKGDEIHVTDSEGDWWSGWNASAGGGGGSSRGVVGQFPANYLEPEPLSREAGAGAGADQQGQGQQQQKALESMLSLESVGSLESPRLLPPLEHTPRQPSPAAPAP